jgi:hypothetical protein
MGAAPEALRFGVGHGGACSMMLIAIAWLICAAIFLEAVARAPVLDDLPD